MSEFLNDYLSRGFSNIVMVSYEFREESGGFQDEHTYETVVAERNGKFFKVDVHEKRKYGPRGETGRSIEETEISAVDYSQLKSGKNIIDSPEAKQKIAAEQEHMKTAQALDTQLNESAPKCPNHKKRMTRKLGPKGPFWGCPEFPDCRRTRSLTAAQRDIYQRYKNLILRKQIT